MQNSRPDPSPTKIVAVDEAQANYLKANDRIAGYPIVGKPVVLNANDLKLIKHLLLSDIGYATPLIRCANQVFYGIRFTIDSEKVEFAVGKPCNQVIWAFQGNVGLEQWGGVMKDKHADEIVLMVKSALKNDGSASQR